MDTLGAPKFKQTFKLKLLNALKAKAFVMTLGFLALSHHSIGMSAVRMPLPTKNQLPLSPSSYCSGENMLFKKIKQPIKEEWDLLCQNGVATPLFESMITTAYDGANQTNFTPIFVGPSSTAPGFVEVKVAYSMRLKKSAVNILRAEERLMGPDFPYNSPDLSIRFRFDPPPAVDFDADTAFTIVQRSKRTGNRSFDEDSFHTLKLYRLIPNNFDFLLAARTLNAPTELFKKANVLRASLTDPKDPKGGVVVTIMNFLVSDQQGQQDRVEDIFVNYIKNDILNVFNFHQKN